ncbi:MAG: hypothetical protein ACI9FN_002730 [Saprospiraceae bacterium]|jgi:hypothetical protein
MKGILIALFTSVLAMSFVTTMNAQSDKGTITMEITEISSDNAQMAQVAEMMKGTQTKVYFSGDKSVTQMDMMGGMVKMNMFSEKGGEFDILMDAMGQKFWVNMPKTEIAQKKAQSPEMEITYDKSDKKTIAGYECYRMDVVVDGDSEMNIIAYITEELDFEAPVMQGVDMTQFAGFPLEYSMEGGPMQMTITTKEFLATVDEAVFEMNTSGYKKMTMDELQSMGGGGFGF